MVCLKRKSLEQDSACDDSMHRLVERKAGWMIHAKALCAYNQSNKIAHRVQMKRFSFKITLCKLQPGVLFQYKDACSQIRS